MHANQRVSRQTFFSEDNLFMLLNVVHETVNDPRVFDKLSGDDRQVLFEVMTQTMKQDATGTLTDLNKRVLRNIYTRSVHKNKPQQTPNIPQSAFSSAGEAVKTTTHTIRDADVHVRKVPTTFQERPQITSISHQAHSQHSVDDVLKQMEQTRENETHKTPTPLQFSEDVSVDNTDVMNKMDDLLKNREEHSASPQPQHSPITTDETRASSTNNNGSMSTALTQFDAEFNQLNVSVNNESELRLDTQREQEKQFQKHTLFQHDATTNGTHVAGTSLPTRLSDELQQQLSSTETILSHSTDPFSSSKLNVDVAVSADVEKGKIDERKFQQQLRMENEEYALNQYLDQNVVGIQEEILIPTKGNYINNVHYLEVSSSDRTRVITSTETPFTFTVYFNSNRPCVRSYPVYNEHYMEESDDYYTTEQGAECDVFLDTTNVRACLGLRGLPNGMGSYPEIDIDFQPTYENVQMSNIIAGPNVDCVFHNVVAIKTNYIQVYFPYDKAPIHPYILLEIDQFSNVYRSSNQNIRKSFCKLFYDRSSAPTTGNALYHTFVPMNNEKKLFTSPLSSIDRLQFNIYNSSGQPLYRIQDIHHIYKIVYDNDSDPTSFCIVLRKYVDIKNFSEHNLITFDSCLEWYNNEWFNTWHQDKGQHLLDQQKNMMETYGKKLAQCEGLSAQEIQCIRDAFASEQIQFDFPTSGYSVDESLNAVLTNNNTFIRVLPQIKAFLTRDEGHLITRVGKYESGVFSEVETSGGLNCVCIDLEKVFDETTGVYSPVSYETNFTLINTFLKNHIHFPLITGYVYNQSVSTNISMTVITRDDENVVLNKNI